MQNYTDEELVAKYKESRDHQFLTELFTRHSDILYRNALRKMKNPADAEDIIQTAYIKMINDLFLYKGTGSVIGWMLQVVIHTCFDRLRSEKSRLNRDKKIMSERIQTTQPKNYELTEMIETHLNKLPEIYKVPITLQIMDGLTIKEVSDALEIPEKTIRSQIARGLEKLKASLQSVGVTASVVSVGDMLREIQHPMTPEIFKSSQYFNSLYQKKAIASSKIAIVAGSKGIVSQSLVGVILVFAATAVSVLGWLHFTKEKPITTFVNPVQTQIVNNKEIKKWNFENKKNLLEYQDLGMATGSIYLADSRGVDGSSALIVEDESLIELDISKYKFPIKISYKTDVLLSSNADGFDQKIFRKNYLKGQKIYDFFELFEKTILTVPKNNENYKLGYTGYWFFNEAYIDENSVDFWINGHRGDYLQGASDNKSKIFLYIRGKAIIDDLSIESIDIKSVPEKSNMEKAVSSLVFKEGSNDYELDKAKIVLSIKGDFKPKLKISAVENFEYFMGVKSEVDYPYLNEKGSVEWVKLPQKLTKKWTFEDYNQLYDFKLISGQIVFAAGNGENKTNCIGIGDESVIEIDISKFKLPIKVSYSFDVIVPKGKVSKGIVLLKSNYQSEKNIFSFVKLHAAPSIDVLKNKEKNSNSSLGFFGEWLRADIYVTENCVDIWFYGNRTGVICGTSTDNRKLYLNIKDRSIIDNLQIESIDSSSAPDISAFIAYTSAIPFIKGAKDYSRLETEKAPLNLEKNSLAVLGICDKTTIENSIGLNKKIKVSADVLDKAAEKAKAVEEFLHQSK